MLGIGLSIPQVAALGTGGSSRLPTGTQLVAVSNSFVQRLVFSAASTGALLGGVETYAVSVVQPLANMDGRYDVFYNLVYPYAQVTPANANYVDRSNHGLRFVGIHNEREM